MSSYDIRQEARQVLKNLPNKYNLFGVPIALTLLSGYLAGYINFRTQMVTMTGEYSADMAGVSPFPFLIDILLGLFTLSASYTILEVIRRKRDAVSYNDLTRTFNGTYLLHLFLIFLVRSLLLLPWFILIFVSAVFLGLGAGLENTALTLLGTIGLVVGFVFMIIKSYAYSQAELILFDRVEEGHELDPFAIIKESKTLMSGRKFDLFILQLSFLGWYILTALTFGLLTIYVLPYRLTAEAIFYDNLKTSTLPQEEEEA